MKAGGWPSILGMYLCGVCGGATVGKVIPLAGEIERTFGIAGADYGWFVALVALPAALLAIPSGALVDRWGSKRVIAAAALIGVAANAAYLAAQSAAVLYAARAGEGVAMVLMYTAAPAFLIATVSGPRRTKAMTLWSTYTPVGTALGLGLAGAIADAGNWRLVFAAHATLYAAAGLLLLLQPGLSQASQAAKSLGERVAELFSAFQRPRLLALGVAFLLIISLGIGVNITLPLFIAQVHSLLAGTASSMVASVTLVMVLGSAGAGLLLSRGISPVGLFALWAAAGWAAGSLSFYPGLSLTARYLVMIAWFLVSGAALATILAALPLAADPARPGAAAAMLTFAGAVATFLTPPLWLGILASGTWLHFAAVLAVGWVVALGAIATVTAASRARIPSSQTPG